MPFAAKSSPPNPEYCTYRHPSLVQAARQRCTVFTCLPGYLDTECLLAEFLDQQRQVLWLRLEPEDGDPATFILSLLHAIQTHHPGLGNDLIESMRRSPGPVSGWVPLFHLLARALSEALGENGTLVLEHVHKLAPTQPTLGLVGAHLLTDLAQSITCILISHERLPPAGLPGYTHAINQNDLRLPSQVGADLAHDAELCLPDKVIRQAIRLADGRVGALKALLAACEMFGQDFLQEIIQQGHDVTRMLSIILTRWLAIFDEQDLQGLTLCCKIEYSHPDLLGSMIGQDISAHCPWLQPLGSGWQRLRCLWAPPLRAAIRDHGATNPGLMKQLAQRLASIGEVEHSIRLFCTLGDFPGAVGVIAEHAEQWMDLGQWEQLENCLEKLPGDLLDDYPQLLFMRAEIMALSGRADQARRVFAKASTLFLHQGDQSRGCQSLLAESALCARQADTDRAQFTALTARDLAHAAGLDRLHCWAEWQLGCLAISLNQLPEAEQYLSRATAGEQDSFLALAYYHLSEFLRQKIAAEEEIKSHYRAYLSAEAASAQATQRLEQALNIPARDLPAAYPTPDWRNLPVIFRLAAPEPAPQDSGDLPSPGWQARLKKVFSQLRPHHTPNGAPVPPPPIGSASMLQLSLAIPEYQHPTQNLVPAPQSNTPPQVLVSPLEEPSVEVISAYLLGPFRLLINNTPLSKPPGSRGLAVLKYMLMHRGQLIPRDVLMDTFWPDADPESARNSLNVAMHSLRQALRSITPLQVIRFENGIYRLNPDLHVWVDVEQFERHLKTGAQLESSGQIADAVQEYEAATNLYQGDLLADDPYEEWPVFDREHLRIAYLDILDRLSQIYLSQEQYVPCIDLCRRILERDNCREDAHRRLMRCYHRQGQQHLALRQYHACVEALHNELGVQPTSSTVALYQRIHSRESI